MKSKTNKLKEIRKALGVTQEELALKLGVNKSKIKNIEAETQSITIEVAKELNKVYNINLGWLLTDKGSMYVEEPAFNSVMREEQFESECINAPYFAASAGGGHYLDANQTYPVPLFEIKKLGVDPKRVAVIEICGQSMYPSINDGDILIVESEPSRIIDSEVYIINYEDQLYCKRILKNIKSLILKSDNPEYSPITVEGQEIEKLRIVGRVLFRLTKIAKKQQSV